MSLDWYVVETHPFAEAKAETNLRRQGFETYTPRYRKLRRHARRCDEVMAPLFPRYIFVAIDSARQSLRAIHSTFGVARLVSFGDRPAFRCGDRLRKQRAARILPGPVRGACRQGPSLGSAGIPRPQGPRHPESVVGGSGLTTGFRPKCRRAGGSSFHPNCGSMAISLRSKRESRAYPHPVPAPVRHRTTRRDTTAI